MQQRIIIVQEYCSVLAFLFLDSYDQDTVHGVIVEAVLALGYRHPTTNSLK